MAESRRECKNMNLRAMASFYTMLPAASLACWKLYHRLKAVPELSHIKFPTEKEAAMDFCINVRVPDVERLLQIQNVDDDQYIVRFIDPETRNPVYPKEDVTYNDLQQVINALLKITTPIKKKSR